MSRVYVVSFGAIDLKLAALQVLGGEQVSHRGVESFSLQELEETFCMTKSYLGVSFNKLEA